MNYSSWAELRASLQEEWALLQESLVGAQDGGVVTLRDVELHDRAGEVVEVSEAIGLLDILLLSCEWKSIAVLDSIGSGGLNVSIGGWGLHFDVDGLLDDDGWAVNFGLGHCEFGVVRLWELGRVRRG